MYLPSYFHLFNIFENIPNFGTIIKIKINPIVKHNRVCVIFASKKWDKMTVIYITPFIPILDGDNSLVSMQKHVSFFKLSKSQPCLWAQ